MVYQAQITKFNQNGEIAELFIPSLNLTCKNTKQTPITTLRSAGMTPIYSSKTTTPNILVSFLNNNLACPVVIGSTFANTSEHADAPRINDLNIFNNLTTNGRINFNIDKGSINITETNIKHLRNLNTDIVEIERTANATKNEIKNLKARIDDLEKIIIEFANKNL